MNDMRHAVNGIVIELIPDSEQGGFTACIPNIPAYGEGETEEGAIEDLKEALIGFIEVYGLQEALKHSGTAPQLRSMPIGLSEFVGMC